MWLLPVYKYGVRIFIDHDGGKWRIQAMETHGKRYSIAIL